jgi:hypothetical protein
MKKVKVLDVDFKQFFELKWIFKDRLRAFVASAASFKIQHTTLAFLKQCGII